MAPSDVKKEGASFDLAIALGILAATQQLSANGLNGYRILGELSLDGSIRGIQGALPICLALKQSGAKNILLAQANAKEAGIVAGINVFAINSLREAVEFLNNNEMLKPFTLNAEDLFTKNSQYDIDFSEVKGQYLAKRALETAVAGNHNMLFIGPPGAGKTMLAKRIPTIMPDLTLDGLRIGALVTAGLAVMDVELRRSSIARGGFYATDRRTDLAMTGHGNGVATDVMLTVRFALAGRVAMLAESGFAWHEVSNVTGTLDSTTRIQDGEATEVEREVVSRFEGRWVNQPASVQGASGTWTGTVPSIGPQGWPFGLSLSGRQVRAGVSFGL